MSQQYDYNKQTRLLPGMRVTLLLPYSEVCMHMRVADHLAEAELTNSEYPGIQLYTKDGHQFSGSITTGEAGVYRDDQGFYFYPPADGTNYPRVEDRKTR